MEFQNVKAACISGGKKAGSSTELDDQPGDDPHQSKHADGDSDDFQPISGLERFGGRALDPFIPSSLGVGRRAVIMSQIPAELGLLAGGKCAFHENR